MTDHARPMPLAPVAMTTDLPLAGVALIVLGALFMTVVMLGASMAPGYDVAGGAISDLGVVSQTRLLFNGTLVIVGILNLVAGVLLYRWHRRAGTLVAFVVAGLGAAGAGLFPLDSAGPHGLFALGAFVFFNLEAVAIGTLVAGPMRWISLTAGFVGLVFVGLMVVGDGGNPAVFGPIGHGGAERMIVYPSMLWVLTFGGYLLGRHVEGRSPVAGDPLTP
jgi:hypothetical membrane protein